MTHRRGSKWRVLYYRLHLHRRTDRISDSYTVKGDGATVLDEVVLEQALHLEQMSTTEWWLRIGDKMCTFTIGQDGKVASQTDWEAA